MQTCFLMHHTLFGMCRGISWLWMSLFTMMLVQQKSGTLHTLVIYCPLSCWVVCEAYRDLRRENSWLNCVHDRRNIARGLSVKYLVADTVINYIKTHQLYTTNPVAHQPWLSSVFMQAHTSSSNFEELFLSDPMCFAYIYGTIFRRDTCLVSVRT